MRGIPIFYSLCRVKFYTNSACSTLSGEGACLTYGLIPLVSNGPARTRLTGARFETLATEVGLERYDLLEVSDDHDVPPIPARGHTGGRLLDDRARAAVGGEWASEQDLTWTRQAVQPRSHRPLGCARSCTAVTWAPSRMRRMGQGPASCCAKGHENTQAAVDLAVVRGARMGSPHSSGWPCIGSRGVARYDDVKPTASQRGPAGGRASGGEWWKAGGAHRG